MQPQLKSKKTKLNKLLLVQPIVQEKVRVI